MTRQEAKSTLVFDILEPFSTSQEEGEEMASAVLTWLAGLTSGELSSLRRDLASSIPDIDDDDDG